MIQIAKQDSVFILSMDAEENRFNPTFVDAFNAALDEVEAAEGPAAMVTTGASAKFYSNGLDLEWIQGAGDEGPAMISDVLRIFARLLEFPVASVAAMNGHAFAGGGMMAMAHDYRVMRSDRGYFCLPEVDLGMPLADGMTALLQAKLSAGVLRDLLLTGRRVGGDEAKELGIVDDSAEADRVLPLAVERAQALATKNRGAYRALKRGMYRDAIAVLKKAELPI